MRGLAAGDGRNGDALRAVAAELASCGFDTRLLDLAPTGEPTALHVRNPVNRAYAEVDADDGGLELRCWCGPDDDDGIVARIFRLLAREAGTAPLADPASQSRRLGGRRESPACRLWAAESCVDSAAHRAQIVQLWRAFGLTT